MAYIPPAKNVLDTTSAAYHGTTDATARTIVTEKKGFSLPSKSGEENRYGCGVYFWMNSREQAKWWAVKRHKGCGAIAVIRSTVEFGKHINLMSTEGVDLLREAAKQLKARQNLTKITEAAALTFLATNGLIDTAMVLDFPENQPRKPIFTGALSPDYARLILCVYKVEKILESEIILSEAA